MNLNYVYYFKVLAETEHYTHAANLLGITQPSLSHAIRLLEQELQVYLFEKQGRNIKLTKYGHIFYDHIQQGLLHIEKGKQQLISLSSQTQGQIDLGFIYTLGARFVPHTLKNFLNNEEYKDIKFTLRQGTTTQLIKGLKEELYDVVFCSYVENEKDIQFTPITKEDLVVIVPKQHPLASYTSIDLKQLEHENIVYYSKTSGIRPLLDSLFKKIDMQPNIICEVEEDSAVIGLVDINYGVAIVPDIPMIDTFPLKKLKIDNIEYQRYIYLATMKNRFVPPAVHHFCNYILHHIAINE